VNAARTSPLGKLREAFRRHFYLPDTAAVDFSVAVVIANRLPGDPVWGMVVGAAGGGKTEAVESVGGLPEVHRLSSLTSKTFLSGKGPASSLLHRMDAAGKTLMLLKDFGTILSMRSEERSEILAALREIYDGSYSRETGNGAPLFWSGRRGFLAGTTPAIDAHHAVVGILGERWVYLRLPKVDQTQLSVAAFRENRETEMRAELKASVVEFVEGRNLSPPDPEPVEEAITAMAIRTAWIRSPVPRDMYTREITGHPSPEEPTRITKQLRQLWKAAVVIGHEDPLAFVGRVARDSTRPPERRDVLNHLATVGFVSTTEIRERLHLPSSTVTRLLEDLDALGLIEVVGKKETGGRPVNIWALTEPARELLPPTSFPRYPQREGRGTHNLGDIPEKKSAGDFSGQLSPNGHDPWSEALTAIQEKVK